jgi:hypothetical protein
MLAISVLIKTGHGMEFNVGKWLSRVIYEPAYYSDLCDYVESNEHLDAHILSRSILSLSEDQKLRKVADVPEDLRQIVIDSMSSSIASATETFSRQMIVVAVTLTEGMIGEYAQCVFLGTQRECTIILKLAETKVLFP